MFEECICLDLQLPYLPSKYLSMDEEKFFAHFPKKEENAYKGNYHIQGTTDKQMLFDDIRIPLKDENGRTYNINKFGLKLLTFFRNLGIKIERTTSNNMLIVTIK
jgi:hypothetical protein